MEALRNTFKVGFVDELKFYTQEIPLETKIIPKE